MTARSRTAVDQGRRRSTTARGKVDRAPGWHGTIGPGQLDIRCAPLLRVPSFPASSCLLRARAKRQSLDSSSPAILACAKVRRRGTAGRTRSRLTAIARRFICTRARREPIRAWAMTGASSFRRLLRRRKSWRSKSAVIDGEAVVYGSNGLPDFQQLRRELGLHKSDRLRFHAFDLLYLDGYDC